MQDNIALTCYQDTNLNKSPCKSAWKCVIKQYDTNFGVNQLKTHYSPQNQKNSKLIVQFDIK